jgi:hypothetical protein
MPKKAHGSNIKPNLEGCLRGAMLIKKDLVEHKI